MKRRKETETKGVKKHKTARRRREGPEPRQESVRPVPAFTQARGPRPRRRLTSTSVSYTASPLRKRARDGLSCGLAFNRK